MTEVSFYHLTRQGLPQALPLLLMRVLESGLRAVVLAGSEERVEVLVQALWTFDQDSFLPHGSKQDGYSDRQPVYLTAEEENPNDATILLLVDGGAPAFLNRFDRCLDLFDGRDEAAVEAARDRWRQNSAAGHDVKYWQQTEQGGWQQQA